MDKYNKWLKEFKEITEKVQRVHPPRAEGEVECWGYYLSEKFNIISLENGLYLINDSKNYLVLTKENTDIKIQDIGGFAWSLWDIRDTLELKLHKI